MRITSAHQVEWDVVQQSDPDAIVVASGYESRARYLAEHQLRSFAAKSRYALGFEDRRTDTREENDRCLVQLGYDVRACSGDSGLAAKAIMQEIATAEKARLSILVDYSSMTRIWYAAIIDYLASALTSAEAVDVCFLYSIAHPTLPPTAVPNAIMAPIPGYCHLDLPIKPTALVIGLGYQEGQALGLAQYIEAGETFAFHADPLRDPRFAKTASNNEELLRRLGPRRVFTYPFDRLEATGAALSALCYGLIENYRVILAPLGPKPFSLLCLLLAKQMASVDVWRVSGGNREDPVDRVADGNLIAYKVTFAR